VKAGIVYDEIPATADVLTGKIKKLRPVFRGMLTVRTAIGLKVCNPNFKILFEMINSIISIVSCVPHSFAVSQKAFKQRATAHARVFCALNFTLIQ
jgi:hypothetical protein